MGLVARFLPATLVLKMPNKQLQKYGAPLYAVEWVGDYAYMCGGGNLGIENKCAGVFIVFLGVIFG